jgi:hypothetical protein
MAHKYPADWSRVHGFFAAVGGFVDGWRLLSLEDIAELVLNKEIVSPLERKHPLCSCLGLNPGQEQRRCARSLADDVVPAAMRSAWKPASGIDGTRTRNGCVHIIIYALWWDKPLDVQCHIMVRTTSTIAYRVDAFSITISALLGASPVTAYIEDTTAVCQAFSLFK